jgi:hypothetical protein
MKSFWITFKNRASGCIEAPTEKDAHEAASAVGEVASCEVLPYPADPRLNKYHHPQHGACPSFCYSPTSCVGRGACPMSHSCTD